jgi:probable HAF family extracellular repeat protein
MLNPKRWFAGTTSVVAIAAALIMVGCGSSESTPTPSTLTDTTPPTVTITDNVLATTARGSVTFTFTFSEAIDTSFNAAKVTVIGGTAGAFTRSSNTVSTLVVAPTASATGTITVSVAAGAFRDLAGNANTSPASGTQAFDTASPSPFQGLGDLPGGAFNSAAYGVSADGSVVVGTGTTDAGEQAFRWTAATGMVSLGNLPDHSFLTSGASRVSADGSVIVGNGDPVGSGYDTQKGYRWTLAGGMTDLGTLNGSPSHVVDGVSADGSVVVGEAGNQAFRWTQSSGMVGLGFLTGCPLSRAVAVSADGSVVAGSGSDATPSTVEQAFVWTSAGGIRGLGYLPGGTYSFPNAISPDGTVVVGSANSSAGEVVFRWTESTGLVNLGSLLGRTTHPLGVSQNGAIIVGGGGSDATHGDAFIWDADHGMRILQSVLTTDYNLDLTGWHLQSAFGITPDGSIIVGWGTNPSGQQEAFRVVLSNVSANTTPARQGR